MSATSFKVAGIAGTLALCLLASCARNRALLEISGTILYEKPKITKVSHELIDSRTEGGSAVVKVAMTGDPGLAASFDIYPGVAERLPMKETAEGSYSGEFTLPGDVFGGPFTIVVRLRHEAAGEVIWRDPNLITIPLLDLAR